MASTHVEIESKVQVDRDVVMPSLAELPGVVAEDVTAGVDLEALYFDTADLRLARAHITLRRRVGGADDGWHLKLPAGPDARTEIQVASVPGEPGVPVELLALVRCRVRELAVEPVVVLRTRRRVHRLVGDGGQVLAEVADDTVEASLQGTSSTPGAPGTSAGAVTSWREWEVELVGGERGLLSAAAALLASAGGTRSPWSSKLEHALGGRLSVRSPAREEERPGSAGAVVQNRLRSGRDDLLGCDPWVRLDEPDAVHRMRVACRVLRSTMSTFRPVLPDERVAPLRQELGWLGRALGELRDVEVSTEALMDLVRQEPVELVRGAVACRLEEERALARSDARSRVEDALTSSRYLKLLDLVDAVVDTPEWARTGSRRAVHVVPRLVRHDLRRLDRAMKAARREPAGSGRDDLLHDARKAAKQARYAAETAVEASGHPAGELAHRVTVLQTLLGHHHDAVELSAILFRVAGQAEAAGESTFAIGRLHALVQVSREALEGRIRRAWSQVQRERRRRWLR